MIKYIHICSDNAPQLIEMTENKVFVAQNIHSYSSEIDGHLISGYTCDYLVYTKDEYIQLLADQNNNLQNELLDTQAALCDVYELIGGGEDG